MLRTAFPRVLLIALGLSPALASADDFAPPPWSRSDPFALTAEWEFSTPANPTLADGGLTNVYTKGGGPVITDATITVAPLD